jgi:hypothetical protein
VIVSVVATTGVALVPTGALARPAGRAPGTVAIAATAPAHGSPIRSPNSQIAVAAPARQWTVRSPSRQLAATVSQARPGAPLRLAVRRAGRKVLGADLGIATSAGSLAHGLRFTGRRIGSVARSYTTPVGKRALHQFHARTMTLSFRRAAMRLQLQLDATNDGIAYRYTVPGHGRVRITREASSFDLPPGTKTWLQRYRSNYEGLYEPSRVGQVVPGRYAFPALLGLPHKTWALLSESDVTGRYAASHLTIDAAHPAAWRVTAQGNVSDRLPLTTPWRVAVVGGLNTIVDSDLVESLGGPSQVPDTSWIEPGRVGWSWWSDTSSPQSLEAQEREVDFAASMGWEYVLVDEGWSPAWVPQLVAYARAHGIRILLWARWSDLRTAAQRDASLPLWASWGVAGVKLDYPQSDSQQRMAWYDETARAAAQQHLLVDFHGCTLPRGIQRRWPNVMTMEAVTGAEAYIGGGSAITPAHNATLPFTRNAVGSMDYTPVTFSATGRQTTAGQELALSVVFESGLQHFADSPASYLSRPIAADFLRHVPVAWDDTRLLGGYPGRSATIARRHGDDWWIGSISALSTPTQVTVPLAFLPPGTTYTATIDSDAPNDGLQSEQRVVTSTDALTVTLAPNGGAAAHLAAGAPLAASADSHR